MHSGSPTSSAPRDYGQVFVRDDLIGGRKLYRVRIGPMPDVPEFDRIVAALEKRACLTRISRSTSCDGTVAECISSYR